MKKIIFLSILFLSLLSVRSQTVFCLSPSCPQKITSKDTAIIFAQLTTSDGYKSITFSQLSGPSSATMGVASTTWLSGLQAIATLPISGTIPGTYVFKVTGASTSGSTGIALDSLIVSAPPVIPPVRTVVSVTLKLINGIWTPLFVFSDQTTQ